MSRIFALADLHLSTSGDKPMDIFGEPWSNHAERMARNWDRVVDASDHVLVPGDISWARKLTEATGDLEWIGSRPGRKLLLKGNHDSWWSGTARVRRALPDGCEVLHNDSHRVAGWVVIGARGWTAPDDPLAGTHDRELFQRELHRLELSWTDAERRFDPSLPRLAMLHFPPWIRGREPTAVVEVLRRARVRLCVFGHLHGEDHALAVTGEREGIDFRLVAADALDFTPLELTDGVPA